MNMPLRVKCLLFALVFSVVPATSHAFVSITVAPPALVDYDQPACPVDGWMWQPGYWAWDDDAGEYYWVPGEWVAPPRVGWYWTPGWWGWGNGIYAWHVGYWGPQVGWYGGINYGFGFWGDGYWGGEW